MDGKLKMENLRIAVRSLGEGGKEFSHALVFETLGLETPTEKKAARVRLNAMLENGELTRVEPGRFIYNFQKRLRNGPMLECVWRFVRAAKPGWTLEECSLMTRVSYSHATKYMAWLEAEGFVQRTGRNENNAFTYKKTEKARAHPETPYPPIKPTDPFAKERMAAATITRLMLCADPCAVKTGRDICEACRVLLARFEKNNTESRTINENETKTEECHVE